MNATGWKGTKTFGVRVGVDNAAKYFNREWSSVEIEIDGELHNYPLHENFWTTCPEFRGGGLKDWLLRQGLAPWPRGKTPKLKLTPLAGNRFRISSSKIQAVQRAIPA